MNLICLPAITIGQNDAQPKQSLLIRHRFAETRRQVLCSGIVPERNGDNVPLAPNRSKASLASTSPIRIKPENQTLRNYTMPSCLITATNRGIGLELARAAIADGWTVYGSVRNKDAVEPARNNLGPNYRPLLFDVTEHQDVKAAAQGLDVSLDLLINNAGIIGPERQSPLDMDFDGFTETLAINTIAPLAVSQAFLPHLLRGQPGKILTMSSQMSWMGYRKPDTTAYRASKAAVNKVMQCLATELEPSGVPVALIDPGWVRTDMGGPSAEHCPADVAAGVLSIANALTLTDTGKFFKWTGEERSF